MTKIITIDPGDHTGTLRTTIYDDKEYHCGRTLYGENMHKDLWDMIESFKPNTIVFERFALRAGSAIQQTGSTFITCEMIGIIKLYHKLHPEVELVELQPANKEYCGFTASAKDPHYQVIQMGVNEKISEHVRDTFRLYSYWKLFGDRFKNKKQRV